MIETFRIRPLTEADVRTVIEDCGGKVAHPDADRRTERGGDFILGGAAIELKLIDEDGFQKSERQSKLAKLFKGEGFAAPVVVVDRARLSGPGQRTYDRAIEGPLKSAIASARQQLKQTRAERSDTTLSVLWVVNNGYTALNHEDLATLVAHRVRNDTSSIDGVITSGCYFHSDGFDRFFLWPFTYFPIRIVDFPASDALRGAWHRFAERFMTKVVLGDVGADPFKGPVVDTQFELDGITYVKPAPPIGGESDFFKRGRPRRDSTGLTECPQVALAFPGLSLSEWTKFRIAMPEEPELRDDYQAWLQHEHEARAEGAPSRPFVRVPITFEGWGTLERSRITSARSIYEYANHLFQDRVQAMITSAREMKEGGRLPSRYVLLVTDEIGMDRANDLSHIAKVRERIDGNREVKLLLEDVRIFYEHALALASAYAIAEGLDAVMWLRNRRYAWA